MGVDKSIGARPRTSFPSSFSTSSSSGTGGNGGDSDTAASACARAELVGIALKDPIDIWRREAFDEGTGNDSFDAAAIAFLDQIISHGELRN